MPSVITFWQTEEDQKEFFEHLLSTGRILVYPFGPKATEAELIAKPLESYLAAGDLYPISFTRQDFTGCVLVSALPDGEPHYVVSSINSAAIGYRPVSRDGNRLKTANLHVYWEVLFTEDGQHKLRKQPPEFIKWAKAIFRWVRKRNNRDSHGMALPMTSRAFNEMKNGVELVNY